MAEDLDHYQAYYQGKLWNLLPAIYRTLDANDPDVQGPLHEIVNRIGAQAAIVRRSMDRMWEDQSIETCDDWVIPYIADLLATNLVASLDARGQRLDVAKTIYYRRRKGTIAVLEEIAANITGWNVRCVEFFRRLGRTRHNLDPTLGLAFTHTDGADPQLQLAEAEGLVKPLTRTGIGGWADLRNAYGASKVQTAFDEYAHTADFRFGQGQVGWYNIPRLGVFLWRLYSFRVQYTTPVESSKCPGHYTFDPTGREIPLFAFSSRTYGDQWVSPEEWQLPTPISSELLATQLSNLSAVIDPSDSTQVLFNSLGIFDAQGIPFSPTQITANPLSNSSNTTALFYIDPTTGRLSKQAKAPAGAILVSYAYGFSSQIGAGPYDRRILGEDPTQQPGSVSHISGGENTPIAPLAPTSTLVIDDSLTYTVVEDVGSAANGIQQVTVMALNESRPVIRLPVAAPTPSAWTFTGTNGSQLVLDGLLISGGDIVLSGSFDSVILTCCTLDPGGSGEFANPPTIYAQSIDGRDLISCTLWVEAQITTFTIERCITGPIRTRNTGSFEQLIITDSIVQAIRTDDASLFTLDDLKEPAQLATNLRDMPDNLSTYLQGQLSSATKGLLQQYNSSHLPSQALQQALIDDLNTLISNRTALYSPSRFADIKLTSTTLQWTSVQNLQGTDLVRLNRWLLEEAYPSALARKDSALAADDGPVSLSRCTLLGPAYLHRLSASECILNDIVVVDDAQHGCIRFSAWSTGSLLPRQYESVEIAPQSSLFTSSVFGDPGYAQLVSNVDSAIVANAMGITGQAQGAAPTISQGAQDGSEMGAFAGEKNPIKEQSIGIKYHEYMPLGLVPILIHVT